MENLKARLTAPPQEPRKQPERKTAEDISSFHFTVYNRQMKWITTSEDETGRLAADLAPTLKPGDILCLHGNLGMGKSVFARALIRALMRDPAQEVPSPTFTLVQTYDSPTGEIWHFDLYRLKEPDEVYELGWEEALGSAISIIEWPERLGYLLPSDRVDIHLSAMPDGARQLRYTPQGAKKVRS